MLQHSRPEIDCEQSVLTAREALKWEYPLQLRIYDGLPVRMPPAGSGFLCALESLSRKRVTGVKNVCGSHLRVGWSIR